MAHELEQDTASGRTAMVSAHNINPWHRLGTVLPGGLSADQALEHALLRGWDVRKVPALTTLHHEEVLTVDGVTPARDEVVEVPGQFAVVRTNPFTHQPEVLGEPGGIVGSIYTPFQNEQAVEFLAAITDEFSDAEFETAGSMRKGTQVFVTMKLKNFMIGGVDAHNMYLVYLLNHATGANLAFPTNIRVVCANTADWAVASAKYTFRHSASIEARHQAARDALKMSFNYNAIFEAEAEKMVQEKLDLDEFRKVCNELWPQPEEDAPDRTKKSHADRSGVLKNLFLFAETQADVRLTKWGGFNAIVEYLDHMAPSRGTTEQAKADARALRTIDGTPLKQAAFELLKV